MTPETQHADSRAEKEAQQNLLIWKLTQLAQQKGDRLTDVADKLGISYPYLSALLRGTRPITQASKSTLAAMAHYLDVPVAQAFVWAGVLTSEDFFQPKRLESDLETLYAALLSHPDFGAYAPTRARWAALDTPTKVLIAALFERASGQRFMAEISVPVYEQAPA